MGEWKISVITIPTSQADAERERQCRRDDQRTADAKELDAVLALANDAVIGGRRHQENNGGGEQDEGDGVNEPGGRRQGVEAPRGDDDELKAEQRLCPGQYDARLGEHLLDPGMKGRRFAVVVAPPRHRPSRSSQPAALEKLDAVPVEQRQRTDASAHGKAGAEPETALDRDEEIEPDAEGEGQEGKRRHRRDEAVKPLAVLPLLDDVVIGSGAISAASAISISARPARPGNAHARRIARNLPRRPPRTGNRSGSASRE